MADNDQSKLRYDDFIGNVQPDPAKPESTIMLSGFVGHGPEGHARIYPDPTLGTWYDVPEGDVIYSTPISDSKLGGSYIWVRASAQIKPGNPAPAAPAASEAEAVPPQQAAVGFDPTPRTFCHVCDLPKVAMQPTPATHCFICPPHTQNCTPATICTLHGHCPTPAPTPATMCLICPPHQTLATLCTQLCTHGPIHCPPPDAARLPQTNFLCTQGLATFCGCTPGLDCNAAPGNVQTQAPICTQGFPTFCGCTPGIDCMGLAARAPQQANATAVTVCVTDCAPPVNAMMRAPIENLTAPTPQSLCFVCDQKMAAAMQMRAPIENLTAPTPQSLCFVCDPPKMLAAMQPTPTVQTHCFICPPHTQNCQWGTLRTSWFECHTNMAGCTVHICAQAAPQAQALGPPNPHTVAGGAISQCWCPPTHFHCAPQATVATVCTQVGCPTQPVVCGILPPSFGCPQGGGQPQHAMAMAAPAHPNTAATLCTQQPACPPHTVHNSLCICPTPSAFHPCGHNTAATVCTQPPGCPPHTVHNSMCICPTPSAVHQCGGQTFTPTIPQLTVMGACPTFGLCPSVACTPMTPIQNGVFTPFGR